MPRRESSCFTRSKRTHLGSKWTCSLLAGSTTCASFVASRLYYRARLHVSFDSAPITYFIQYVPAWLLKHDFWRSLLYLHQQPPLQNLVAGGIFRIAGPERAPFVLEAIYVGSGFI